jgi:cell division septum initiation protein DivIVA
MRNYWLRIAIGAAAIFTVGMIGVTLARQGVGRVRGVVEGSGPITLPIAFVPFKLDGRKLGSVNKVVLLRDAPKRISSVELEIKLKDSTVASGLAGCHLAANFEAEHKPGSVRVNADPFSSGVFSCLDRDSVPQFQVFGRAVFQPGDVTVPLLLPDDIVNDLKKGDFGDKDQDSIAAAAEARADSISEAVDARADSISDVAQAHADSIVARSERLVDSLRREGTRRADSARQAAGRMADSTPGR